MTDYYGQSSWSPYGTWTLPANTATQLTRQNFISTINSDQEAATATGNAIMQVNGALLCPYPSAYLLNVSINLSDFCDITLEDVPSMLFQFKYVPASSTSPSPQPFIMGTVSVNKTNPWSQMAQRTNMTTGDMIQIVAMSTLPINTNTPGNQSQIMYNDDASDVLVQLYAGVTGQPPAYNVTNKISYMTTAPVVNGKAIFTLTQDGTNGHSLFESGIAFFTVSVQCLTNITSISQIIDHSWDPIPSDLKSATVHFRQGTTSVADNQYVAVARFDGW